MHVIQKNNTVTSSGTSALKFAENMDKENSFKAVFFEYHAALCFFADKIINDRLAAEDVVEDVFIKLWQKQPDFGQYKNIKAVLYISVKNSCLDIIKKKNRATKRITAYFNSRSEATEDFMLLEMVRAEVLRELYAAIQKLPEKRRNVMELIFCEGWDNRKIAEHLNISIHTVKKHKERGIQSLKDSGISLSWLVAIIQFVSSENQM